MTLRIAEFITGHISDDKYLMEGLIAPRIALVLLSLCLASEAAEVTRVSRHGTAVAIKFDPQTRYRVGDYLCVIQENVEIACGKVGIATENTAIVPLQFSDSPITKGDRVELAKMNIASATASDTFSENADNAGDYHDLYRTLFFSNGGGTDDPSTQDLKALSVAALSHSPGIHYQLSVRDKWIGGLFGQALFLSSVHPLFPKELTGTLFGGHLTASYFSDSMFKGTWAMLGAGTYFGNSTYQGRQGSTGVISLFATLGKRWRDDQSFYGVALGFQFMHISAGGTQQEDIDVYTPALIVDMGWIL